MNGDGVSAVRVPKLSILISIPEVAFVLWALTRMKAIGNAEISRMVKVTLPASVMRVHVRAEETVCNEISQVRKPGQHSIVEGGILMHAFLSLLSSYTNNQRERIVNS